MNEDKILDVLTEIRITCAQTNVKICAVEQLVQQHEKRIEKLENQGGSLKQDLIMYGVKIIGTLTIIIASLTGAAPLLKGFIK